MTTLLSSSSWDEAKAWIERNGGFVHPHLHFDSTNRHVIYLPSSNQHDTVHDSSRSSSSSSCSSNLLEEGTTILEVPEACLLTLHSVERDSEFGKSLFGAVHSLEKGDDGDNNIIGNDRGNVDHHTNLKGGLYHDAQDVILALYLAYLRERTLKENDCGTQQQQQQHAHNGEEETSQPIAELPQLSKTTTAISQSPWRFYAPYLATLPLSLPSFTKATTPNALSSSSSSSSPFNNQSYPLLLPRQWSTMTIQYRLAGTSLYNRVLKEQRGIRTEYELVKQVWMSKYCSQQYRSTNLVPILFPTFENYDTMMAMVTSRGFANLGYDGVDALVPILDLLDHCRGGGRRNEHVVVEDDKGDNMGCEDDHATERSTSCRESNDDSIQHLGGECLTRSNCDEVHSEDVLRKVEARNIIVQNEKYPILQSSRVGPDVRYTRYYEEEDEDNSETLNKDKTEGSLAKRQKTTMNYHDESIQRTVGGVRVTTSRSIPPGSILRMTYGAKGNAVLLGRYGFCISNNVEPDGKSKTVKELAAGGSITLAYLTIISPSLLFTP